MRRKYLVSEGRGLLQVVYLPWERNVSTYLTYSAGQNFIQREGVCFAVSFVFSDGPIYGCFHV